MATYPSTKDTVATHSLAYDTMQSDYWATIEALRSGTEGMRDQNTSFLPRHSKEEYQQWTYRKDRSFLFPAYDDALAQLSAKPFQKPTTVSENLPESLMPMLADVDMNGRDLTTFAHEVFEAGWDYGLTHILVDFPDTGGNLTAGKEKEMQIRPRFVHYKAPSVFAFPNRRLENGQIVPAEIRIKETQVETNGQYEEVEVEYIRRIVHNEGDTPSWWGRYRGVDNNEWVLEKEGIYTLGQIALVTFYTGRTGYMTARPPLFGLADLNVQHWQVASDYGNILHVNMVPLLASSKNDGELTSVTLGPNRVICLGGTEEWIKFVEHSGTSIASGREELDRIEKRMQKLALEPFLTAAPGTATGRAIDESKSQATIYRSVRALENAIENCFRFAAAWMKTELPDDCAVDVYSDFVASMGGGDTKEITADWQAGLISHETALREKVRRGVLSDSMDVPLEIETARGEHEVQPVPLGIGEEDEDADDGK